MTTTIEALKAAADAAITMRRAELYPSRTTPAQRPDGPAQPPRDWDGRSPTAHYGADGRLLPEVAAYRAALRGAST